MSIHHAEDRQSAGFTGAPRDEGPPPRTESRVRHLVVHRAVVRRGPSGRGRVALSGPPPDDGSRADQGRVAAVGRRPPRPRFYPLTPKGAASSKRTRNDGARSRRPSRRFYDSLRGAVMGVWSRIVRTFRAGRHTDDIEEELQFHLEMDMADGRDRRGAPASRERGADREETRAAGVLEWLDSAFRDARYGLRQVGRTPALALAVVLSLAIGIGANTAIFSLVDAAILRPLPVHDAGALRIVVWTSDAFPHGIREHQRRIPPISPTGFRALDLSPICIAAWRANRPFFERSSGSPTRTLSRLLPTTLAGRAGEPAGSAAISSRLWAFCPSSAERSETTRIAWTRSRWSS